MHAQLVMHTQPLKGRGQEVGSGGLGGGGGILGSGSGVTHENHGGALRHHEGQHHVAHLALSQCIHPSILRLPLLPTVPAEVVIGAVSILFTICIIVLAIVCHQIIQGEAVVSYNKVDALVWLPASHNRK